MARYCYHVTNGTTRSALSCGTITAETMEGAAQLVAQSKGLVIVRPDPSEFGPTRRPYYATADGKRRNIYILHDPN